MRYIFVPIPGKFLVSARHDGTGETIYQHVGAKDEAEAEQMFWKDGYDPWLDVIVVVQATKLVKV